MESGQEHAHYWPGDGCIPITPQAVRFGYEFPVYVTNSVWGESITWTPNKHIDTSAEKRIYDLLDSCYKGMGKALAPYANSEETPTQYQFKHWYWDRLRPYAKKPTKAKFGARLLLDPDTEEPWLLIFDPDRDGKEVLKHGEPAEDSGTDGDTGEVGVGDGADLDDGNADEAWPPADDPYFGTAARHRGADSLEE